MSISPRASASSTAAWPRRQAGRGDRDAEGWGTDGAGADRLVIPGRRWPARLAGPDLESPDIVRAVSARPVADHQRLSPPVAGAPVRVSAVHVAGDRLDLQDEAADDGQLDVARHGRDGVDGPLGEGARELGVAADRLDRDTLEPRRDGLDVTGDAVHAEGQGRGAGDVDVAGPEVDRDLPGAFLMATSRPRS